MTGGKGIGRRDSEFSPVCIGTRALRLCGVDPSLECAQLNLGCCANHAAEQADLEDVEGRGVEDLDGALEWIPSKSAISTDRWPRIPNVFLVGTGFSPGIAACL